MEALQTPTNVIPLFPNRNILQNEVVIVVGSADVDHGKLADMGFAVYAQWRKIPPERPFIPLQVDRIIVLSDSVDTLLVKLAEQIAEKESLPITFTRSTLDTLAVDILNKTKEPKDEVVEVETLTSSKNVMTTTNTETTTNTAVNSNPDVDGRSIGANVQKAKERADFVRGLLAKNPEMPTEEILERVQKKFKRGITPARVHEIRRNEFGVKFGGRGKVVHIDPNAPEASEGPVQPQQNQLVTKRGASRKLDSLLHQLRMTMEQENIRFLRIPREGTAQVVYEIVEEMAIH